MGYVQMELNIEGRWDDGVVYLLSLVVALSLAAYVGLSCCGLVGHGHSEPDLPTWLPSTLDMDTINQKLHIVTFSMLIYIQ